MMTDQIPPLKSQVPEQIAVALIPPQGANHFVISGTRAAPIGGDPTASMSFELRP